MKVLNVETVYFNTTIDSELKTVGGSKKTLRFPLDYSAGVVTQMNAVFIVGEENTKVIKPYILRSAQETPRSMIKTVTDNQVSGILTGEGIEPEFKLQIPFEKNDVLLIDIENNATISVTYPVQVWFTVMYTEKPVSEGGLYSYGV